MHNFSHPHEPLPNATSINSHIDGDHFPCTWGTFTTVALLLSRLPPGSQASVRDVAEAYRTIPVAPAQWPGLVIHLQAEDRFAVNICNNFGLTSAGGMYGMVADAGADLFRGCGIGPLAKWVDDHIFFRIRREHLLKRSHIGAAGMRSELTFERGGTVVITRVKSGEAKYIR